MVEDASPRLIADDVSLAQLIDELRGVTRYALDTEFHRERTYFPQVALIQIATDERITLVDPLACDMLPFAELLGPDHLVVMHACRQDLEVLERCCGVAPVSVIDTQLAAGFLGYTTPSLATLVEAQLHQKLPKADRLTDWLKRPLRPTQLTYAASDVAHLLELHDQLRTELERRGRWEWVTDEMAELMAEPRGPRDPQEAWRRIKEVRHLKGLDLAVAQAVAAWREERAIELDLTPRHVLGDLGVVGIAVARPSTVEEMRSIRGVDGRGLRGNALTELLAVLDSHVDTAPRRARTAPLAEIPVQLRPALPLLAAWISQLARDLDIEAALLAARSDLEDLLRGDPDTRARRGWRAELVGEPVDRLLDGKVALAFERGTGLVMVPRAPAESP